MSTSLCLSQREVDLQIRLTSTSRLRPFLIPHHWPNSLTSRSERWELLRAHLITLPLLLAVLIFQNFEGQLNMMNNLLKMEKIIGTSAEMNLKTVKLASCRYLDTLPTEGANYYFDN